MENTSPIKGTRAWIARKFFNNYWSLNVLAVIVAVPLALAGLWLDRNGLTDVMIDAGLAPVMSAETARDFAGVAAGINAAFISLYFSITLIVLSLAAGSLSARLIDRWLDKQSVRISIAGLSFSLIISLVTLLAIDGDAAIADVPLGLIALTLVLQLVNVAMLAVSLHDLGRTMFVDRSIAALQKGASSPPIQTLACEPRSSDEWQSVLRSEREGYVEGIDLDKIAKILSESEGIRVCVAPGQHVMLGDVLICATANSFELENLHEAIPIDTFRSDAQGAVFRIRLLIEIAARALSPGINDFYTALACVDAISVAMRGHRACWTANNMVPCWAKDRRIELPGQDFASLFSYPLSALRQSSCDYPAVTIRLIENFLKLAKAEIETGENDREYIAFLIKTAKEFGDHAIMRADFDADRDAIADRMKDLDGLVAGQHRA